ncbi:MAG: diguanylate cyclase [Propionivibrio sp.]
MSLKYQLVLPFALLILLIPVGTGWMLYRAGAATVDALISRVQQETIARINETTEARLSYALSALGTFTDGTAQPRARPNGAVMPAATPEVLESRAWTVLRHAQEPGTYVCFGGTDGRFVGIYRINGYLHELYRRLPGDKKRYIFAKTDANSLPIPLRSDDFDPRTRPWYQSAIDHVDPVWSPVYFDFTSKQPIITVARSVSDAKGNRLGVAAVDVELRMISDVLRSLTISRNGVAFVMDGNGRIVASSEEGAGNRMTPSAPDTPPDAAENPLIQAARTQVLEWKRQLPLHETKLRELRDRRTGAIGIAASRVAERYDLDWTTVVVIPSSDFTERITDSFNRGLAIAVAAVFLALVFGMWLLNRLLRDIHMLNEAVIRIGHGESIPQLHIDRADEIGQLARSFHEMGHSLRTDRLTGVFNRDYLLNQVRRIRESERKQGRGTHPFALMFIDLDDFKEINDQLGHDCGDTVLVEIASRLRSGVRASDVVVRYGGDEFVILLIDMATADDLHAAEEKIRAIVEAPMALGAGTVGIGISIGWSLYPTEGEDIDALIKTADTRMFEDKRRRKGGNAA